MLTKAKAFGQHFLLLLIRDKREFVLIGGHLNNALLAVARVAAVLLRST